jgi:Glycosyl transferase family 90
MLILICDGTLMAIEDRNGIKFLLEPISAAAAYRIDSIRSLLADIGLPGVDDHRILTVQFGDRAHYDLGSVAYGRRRGESSPAIRLIPDTYFVESHGYQATRAAVWTGTLPNWDERQNIIFWRGSATTNYVSFNGVRVERIEQVPRVSMCLMLKDFPQADVAIMGPAQLYFLSDKDAVNWLRQKGVFRPHVPMIRHADYRFLIDIDGVANSWSFFEKLLLGACILKVASPFEQWFYHEIAAWQHFVPVCQDMSDLMEKIDWCLGHPAEAHAIAERGQKFALQHTLEAAREVVADAVRCSITISL